MRTALIAGTGLALAVLVAIAIGSIAPLPSTLETGHVSGLYDAQWMDPVTQATSMGVTGEGVIVYMDEGVNAHPDLEHCIDSDHHVWTWVDGHQPKTPMGNPVDGHGTVVAGVLCGDGTLSQRYGLGEPIQGVAPDIRLFSFAAHCVYYTSECAPWFEEEAIRIMSHSLSDNPEERAQSLGAGPDDDVLFVQSVGNWGGDGSEANTPPWIGEDRHLGVAAGYADGSGIDEDSARGDKEDPETWPDLTAPGCQYTTNLHPWTDGALIKALLVEPTPVGGLENCPTVDPSVAASNHALRYGVHSGTSIAAPYVSGVAAMMVQVHPGLAALEAEYLLTHTADPFLATEMEDPTPEQFRDEHGYKAGYGFVNATAAVAAAHYMALEPSASAQEAVDAFTVGRSSQGALVLNPHVT